MASKTKSATGLRLVQKPGFEHLPDLSVKNLSAGGKIEQGAQRLSAGRAVMERNYVAYRASLSDTERAKVPELLEKYDLHHLITDGKARKSAVMREWLMRGGDIDAGFNLRAMPNKSAKVWLQNVLGHASEDNPNPHRKWDGQVARSLQDLQDDLGNEGIKPSNWHDQKILSDLRLNGEIEMIADTLNDDIHTARLSSLESFIWTDEHGNSNPRQIINSVLPFGVGAGILEGNEGTDEGN